MATTDFTAPISVICDENKRLKAQLYHAQMTLRDQFAMAALQGMLASAVHPKDRDGANIKEFPKVSYILADAMMKEREAL